MKTSTELWQELKVASENMEDKRAVSGREKWDAYYLAKDNAYAAASKYRKACNKERFDFLVNRESKKVDLTHKEYEWSVSMWNHGTLYTSKELVKLAGGLA